MTKNKFTFQSENLYVDWISFKFQKLEDSTKEKITDYLFKFGFDSYQESGKLSKPIKEPIFVHSKNKPRMKLQVCFVGDNSHWQGTLLHFSGVNATYFYSLVKRKSIDWEIFSSAVLSRFDLYYSRKNGSKDKISVHDFLENCQRYLKRTKKTFSLQKIGKIGF